MAGLRMPVAAEPPRPLQGGVALPAAFVPGLAAPLPNDHPRPLRRHHRRRLAIDFQAIGLTARTVGDVGLLFATLAAPDCRDPVSLAASSSGKLDRPLKIGWFDRLGDDVVDDAARASHQQALEALAALGHHFEGCPPPFDIARLRKICDTISSVGAAREALRYPKWQAR
jgi:Asp-tRNA(Asn)/Glu-tRNA(Gln) amidotransferase A subunit family amidase